MKSIKKHEYTQLVRKYGIVFVLFLVIAFFSLASSKFLSVDNLITILRQVSVTGIVGVGMTFVMLIGGLDLSVGSVAALTGVVSASFMMRNMHPLLAIILGVLAATAAAFLNGLIVSKARIPALIVTLGGMDIFRGIAYLLTDGLPIYGLPREWTVISQGYIFDLIPIPVVVMVISYLAGSFVLNKTCFGRRIYALGGNEEATKLSGINVELTRILTFTICGFLTGIAGILLMFRINSGQPAAANGLEMDVITGVALGGVSMSGGEGKLFGVFVGILIIGVLSNGLIILGVSDYAQMVIKGIVLILAVGLDGLSKRK